MVIIGIFAARIVDNVSIGIALSFHAHGGGTAAVQIKGVPGIEPLGQKMMRSSLDADNTA